MSTPLELAITFTLQAEGKFTHDTGGDTMCGVTQAVYDAYRSEQHLKPQSVRLIDMDEVYSIFNEKYFLAGHCDKLPLKLAIAHADWCYNHGVSGAIKHLQESCGVQNDGIVGAKTLAAFADSTSVTLATYLQKRIDFYHDLASNKPDKYGIYLNGWLNRVENLKKYIEKI